MIMCSYCKIRVGLFKQTSGKWCCEPFFTQCPENRRKNSEKNKGKPCWSKGLTKETDERVRQVGLSNKGKTVSEKNKKLTSIRMKLNNPMKNPELVKKGLHTKYIINEYKNPKMSEETKIKMKETRKEFYKDPENREKQRLITKNWWDNNINSFERKEILRSNRGEKSVAWKGGSDGWYHSEARKLFGQDHCEVCGISAEDYMKKTGKKLSMHCDGHRYRNMERIFWTTVCERKCHLKLEMIDREDK